MDLYTTNGKPLQVLDATVYSRSGKVVGRIKGGKVFGIDRRYFGSIGGDRLVYRSAQNAATSSPFAAANRARFVRAQRAASAMWGNEPDIPE